MPPAPGDLVDVRGAPWVVVTVLPSASPSADGSGAGHHLVSLRSVADDAGPGQELDVVWEVEPGAAVSGRSDLPEVAPGTYDRPEHLDAFLDAIRWGAVTSADDRALQAPFRSGIEIEDYQLEPLVRALRMPRANLLIADDVGLGKTIEAGLVAQELFLRHRARTAIVVCPSALQLQWHDELRDKFGLEFRILDREFLHRLRRSRGVRTNPWTSYPRLIVSIDWLKGDLGMRLLREALPERPELPRRFDLLIVDEVHNMAPASVAGRYAVDSLRTTAIRTLAPHCEHRLFLSATPHNGYSNSFQSLLEMLDPQRFSTATEPRSHAVREVTVRRLKRDITRPDGTPRFPERRIEALEIEHPDEERRIHAALREYGDARLERLAAASGTDRASGRRRATDFVVTLLKKRLFSSPRAFHRTLEVHRDTLERGPAVQEEPADAVLAELFDEAESDTAGDDRREVDRTALSAANATGRGAPSDLEMRLLDEMAAWAHRESGRPDAKARRILDWVDDVVRPGGDWDCGERLVVFTEYRDTQDYFQEQLAARGVPGERVAVLNGQTDRDVREELKARWQDDPSNDPVRLLLATDAASEGISLQNHCRRLLHLEIPWNPNRLEQRNGRVDRHGQPAGEVLIHHPVSAGWREARSADGTLDGDLAFLFRAAEKVDRIRVDLGSTGPVIAGQVEAAMLGRRPGDVDETAGSGARDRHAASRRALALDRSVRSELERLHGRLERSREELGLEPARVERVVATALERAGEPPLVPEGRERVHRVPVFASASWSHAHEGLAHPVTGVPRPITFDHAVAASDRGVVLAHLGHRLVQLSLALLRSAVWDDHGIDLHRVTVRYADPSVVVEPTAVAHGRLVVTGGAGHRLHEELTAAAVRLPVDGRPERLNVGETAAALAAARGFAVPGPLADRIARSVAAQRDALRGALEARSRERSQSLERTLADRAAKDAADARTILEELRDSMEAELRSGPRDLQLSLEDESEREQYRRDADAMTRRLADIPGEIDAEVAAIGRRFAEPAPRLFPVAISVLVPQTGKGER